MNRSFHIDFHWLHRDQGTQLESITFADLTIEAGGQLVTDIEDMLAKTLRNRMRGSAFLLARWLAANWWRLRYEPKSDSMSWDMAHRLGAIGGGYLWPDLALISDGQTMLYSCRRSRPGADGPIRYLASFDEVAPIGEFEFAVDEFVEAVIARLEGVKGEAEDLAVIWADVRQERADDLLTVWRRREAMLGLDPDEAPGDLMLELAKHADHVGIEAVDEVASAFGRDSACQLQVLAGPSRPRTQGLHVPGVAAIRGAIAEQVAGSLLPWQRAERAAAIARREWSIPRGPLSDESLIDLLGLPKGYFADPKFVPDTPVPVAYRNGDEANIEASVPKRRRTSRRFALARLVADHISAGSGDSLLPATDTRTARQKFQRAFGQEFLCPYADLAEQFESVIPTEDGIEEAADRFGVSSLLVKTTLVNRGVLDRQTLSFE